MTAFADNAPRHAAEMQIALARSADIVIEKAALIERIGGLRCYDPNPGASRKRDCAAHLIGSLLTPYPSYPRRSTISKKNRFS
jgi:hypothetical protein